MSTEYLLELVNGAWAIVSLSLMAVTGTYFWHEAIARGLVIPKGRTRFTRGMGLALALFTMAFGIFLRSGLVFAWRHYFNARPMNDVELSLLLVGGVIGVAGFLSTIRALSSPLYGVRPWMATIGAIVIFLAYELMGG